MVQQDMQEQSTNTKICKH